MTGKIVFSGYHEHQGRVLGPQANLRAQGRLPDDDGDDDDYNHQRLLFTMFQALNMYFTNIYIHYMYVKYIIFTKYLHFLILKKSSETEAWSL